MTAVPSDPMKIITRAFKLRFFPRWALRRWPALNARVVVRAEALFPELVGVGRKQRIMFFAAKEGA